MTAKNRLKKLRIQHGYTLDDIANETGINRATYNNYENGKTEPKSETWQKLADYFDVDVGYIQGLTAIKNSHKILNLDFTAVVKNGYHNKLNSILTSSAIDAERDIVLLSTLFEEIDDASDTISNTEIKNLFYINIFEIIKLSVSKEISDDQKITFLKEINASIDSILKQTRVDHDE